MTNEDAIKYLRQIYPNGGHCWLDEQRIEAIGMAVKALQEEPVSDVWHSTDDIPNYTEGDTYVNSILVFGKTKIGYSASVCNMIDKETIYAPIRKKEYKWGECPFTMWANVRDLVNLSNVEQTGKNWKESVSEPSEELAETYLAVFNRKFPILPSLKGKQLADYKNFLNKCQQIFGLKECGIRSIQSKLFEKLTLLWAAWGAEHLQGRQDEKEQYIPVSEELKEAITTKFNELVGGHGEFDKVYIEGVAKAVAIECGFAGAKWQKEKEYTCYVEAFEDGAAWKVENLWKPADGDDLPEIDREVIALLDNGKVVFAHRPPEYWDGKNIVTGKVTRHYPKTYDKGGWNIPNIVYWLNLELPKEKED